MQTKQNQSDSLVLVEGGETAKLVVLTKCDSEYEDECISVIKNMLGDQDYLGALLSDEMVVVINVIFKDVDDEHKFDKRLRLFKTFCYNLDYEPVCIPKDKKELIMAYMVMRESVDSPEYLDEDEEGCSKWSVDELRSMSELDGVSVGVNFSRVECVNSFGRFGEGTIGLAAYYSYVRGVVYRDHISCLDGDEDYGDIFPYGFSWLLAFDKKFWPQLLEIMPYRIIDSNRLLIIRDRLGTFPYSDIRVDAFVTEKDRWHFCLPSSQYRKEFSVYIVTELMRYLFFDEFSVKGFKKKECKQLDCQCEYHYKISLKSVCSTTLCKKCGTFGDAFDGKETFVGAIINGSYRPDDFAPFRNQKEYKEFFSSCSTWDEELYIGKCREIFGDKVFALDGKYCWLNIFPRNVWPMKMKIGGAVMSVNEIQTASYLKWALGKHGGVNVDYIDAKRYIYDGKEMWHLRPHSMCASFDYKLYSMQNWLNDPEKAIGLCKICGGTECCSHDTGLVYALDEALKSGDRSRHRKILNMIENKTLTKKLDEQFYSRAGTDVNVVTWFSRKCL